MLKPIPGYGNYSVSDDGIVVNATTGTVKRPTLNKSNGYLYVDLYREGKRAKRPVHRLVAEAFVPNPEGKPTVDHADGDRTNNSADNLRWATFSEQNSRFATGGRPQRGSDRPALRRKEEKARRRSRGVAWRRPRPQLLQHLGGRHPLRLLCRQHLAHAQSRNDRQTRQDAGIPVRVYQRREKTS